MYTNQPFPFVLLGLLQFPIQTDDTWPYQKISGPLANKYSTLVRCSVVLLFTKKQHIQHSHGTAVLRPCVLKCASKPSRTRTGCQKKELVAISFRDSFGSLAEAQFR